MQAPDPQPPAPTAAGPDVYHRTVVFDGLLAATPSGRVVDELLAAGVSGCNWTVASHSDETLAAITKITQFYWLLEQRPDRTLLVEREGDLERAKREGKLGIVLGFQGGMPLGRNPHLVRVFHRLGVRIIQLTYNEGNALAPGVLEPADGPLTSLGRQAVQEMNRSGVLVDLSHVGRRASLDAIELSADPVIFSHSNPRALHENPRNITDEQMRACAAKGGVVGLATFSAFVGDTTDGRHPGLDDYFRQMDHALALVGPDHVGIGTDIFLDPTDGVWWRAVTGRLYPEVSQGMTYETHNVAGFMHHGDFPAVAEAMLDRGYDEATVRNILGDNWRRVFRQVWDSMTRAPLKERLQRGEVCIGTFLLFLGGGDVAQFFAGLGFDFLILDMEHGSLDLGRARETIQVARAGGVAPLVRVAEAQYHLVTRALDAGAEGIVLPRVEDPQQCRDLVRFARFRPDGERGLTTFGGHNDFAAVPDIAAFAAARNRDVLLFVQIETQAGLERRSDILSVPGLDGCLVGTGDLSFSLGMPGQLQHPEVLGAVDAIFAACRERQLIYTLPVRTPDDTARWQATGMCMMTLATDGALLATGARQFLARVKR